MCYFVTELTAIVGTTENDSVCICNKEEGYTLVSEAKLHDMLRKEDCHLSTYNQTGLCSSILNQLQ